MVHYYYVVNIPDTSSVHHPYFNNHSPSRFQQHQYPNSPRHKNPVSEANLSHVANDGQNVDRIQPQMFRQAPRTPSKLAMTKPQVTSTNLHATSALLASLDKSILQIR